MNVQVLESKQQLGERAAAHGAEVIREAIETSGKANIIVATGASQFEVLSELIKAPGIRWDKVTCFHLDEYVGMPITHPASFRKYLWERFHKQLPLPPRAFYYVDAETDWRGECDRLGAIIQQHPIDVAFIGIGENGHLAFNDPPADFQTDRPYIVVDLDEACRKQQFGEGWFPTLADVPKQAISMSIRQILKSRVLVCSVPDRRKAEAVRAAIEGPLTNQLPASILRQHDNCAIFLDRESSSLLSK